MAETGDGDKRSEWDSKHKSKGGKKREKEKKKEKGAFKMSDKADRSVSK